MVNFVIFSILIACGVSLGSAEAKKVTDRACIAAIVDTYCLDGGAGRPECLKNFSGCTGKCAIGVEIKPGEDECKTAECAAQYINSKLGHSKQPRKVKKSDKENVENSGQTTNMGYLEDVKKNAKREMKSVTIKTAKWFNDVFKSNHPLAGLMECQTVVNALHAKHDDSFPKILTYHKNLQEVWNNLEYTKGKPAELTQDCLDTFSAYMLAGKGKCGNRLDENCQNVPKCLFDFNDDIITRGGQNPEECTDAKCTAKVISGYIKLAKDPKTTGLACDVSTCDGIIKIFKLSYENCRNSLDTSDIINMLLPRQKHVTDIYKEL